MDTVLGNVCPNCGGGFVPRPVRPVRDWVGGNNLASDPPSAAVVSKPVDLGAHAALVGAAGAVPPAER